MRDPKRIPEICQKFQKLWEKYPDWRFGQMVSNLMGPGPHDPFYPEDTEWLAEIETHLREGF